MKTHGQRQGIFKQFAVFAFFAFIILLAAAAVAADNVSIVDIKGRVDTKAPGATEWKKVAVGDTVPMGTEVRTLKGARAVLKWKQGHVVKLSALTTIKLEKSDFDAAKGENSLVNVNVGKVLVKSQKLANKDSHFDVKTPTTIAGVRGTEFMVDVQQNGASTVALVEGQLDISGEGIQSILNENMQVVISPGDTAAPAPFEIPADLKNQLQQDFNSIETAEPETSGAAGGAPGDEAVQDSMQDIIDQIIDAPQQQIQEPPDVPPMPPQ